jgi:hypothetical protein
MRFQITFLSLIIVQGIHSFEEYVGRLYDVFPPARLVSGLISENRERGFIIGNIVLVSFGLWCFFWPVRRSWPSAVLLAWLWVVIELINGVGHPMWSILQRQYTPGLATAPLLLLLALYLVHQLRTPRSS